MPLIDGTVDSPEHTRLGASVDYRCDDGFRPSADFTSTCESDGRWTPQPQDHNCTFVRGADIEYLYDANKHSTLSSCS